MSKNHTVVRLGAAAFSWNDLTAVHYVMR